MALRTGTPADLPAALQLIQELAVYEKAGDQVEVTVEELERDGFGPDKVFDFFVAEADGEVVGIALYYTKYSTWKGKCLFLEDIVVRESFRGKGLGSLLFEAVIRESKKRQVRRMEWQVLDWNTPAIRFYEKYHSNLDPEWINGKLVYDQLQNFES
ncbi:MAG: GNAT family N-acetyltransferase [Salibacteraceae bacterium]